MWCFLYINLIVVDSMNIFFFLHKGLGIQRNPYVSSVASVLTIRPLITIGCGY